MRLNERETNPNPHVNFITALPRRDEEDEENARQLLRALAAQVKPIMQEHGMVVKSLNEVRMELCRGFVKMTGDILCSTSTIISSWDATGVEENVLVSMHTKQS